MMEEEIRISSQRLPNPPATSPSGVSFMSWLPKSNVVVPVDFSVQSLEAIQTALELAQSPANVHVVHVVIPLTTITVGEAWAVEDVGSRLSAARDYLAGYLKQHEIGGITSAVREGDPGLQIAEYAQSIKADLVVMPSHGRHGVQRLLLGSVTERVLRHVECPILVLRRND
jgi:nucleotide-binding universal stress UspA family protein